MMPCYRLKFEYRSTNEKLDPLNLMQVFEEAIRLALIPVVLRKGLNPHKAIAFALPIVDDIRSVAEYADMELTQTMEPYILKDRLNATLQSGIRVTQVMPIKNSEDDIRDCVAAARYRVLLRTKAPKNGLNAKETKASEYQDQLMRFFSEDIIIVPEMNEINHRIEYVDIKVMLLEMNIIQNMEDLGTFSFEVLLRSGINESLGPDALVTAFSEFTGGEYISENILRTEIYTFVDGKLISLQHFGITE